MPVISRFSKNVLAMTMFVLLLACSGSQPALNSDRIEKEFGSYGVEIISQDEARRVSSLYSGEGEDRITRTWAIVEYLDPDESAFQSEHEAIVAGGSIGITFRGAGWVITKEPVATEHIELSNSDTQIGQHMRIGLPARLASHTYKFVVSKNDQSFDYARITEIYHPNYLSLSDLQ